MTILILLVVLAVLLGITCVVLIIVGLVKRRKALWITGLVGLVVPILLVAGGGSLAAYLVYATGREVAEEVAAISEGSEEKMFKWFRWSTGVTLPAETEYIGGYRATYWRDTYYLKFRVPRGFKELLIPHFKEVHWDLVRDRLMPPRDWDAGLGFWDISLMRGKPCYQRVYKDITDTTFESLLVHDEATGLVYFIAMETEDE